MAITVLLVDAHSERQAVELAHALADTHVVAIEASPSRRAQETASVIASHFGCEWHISDELREPAGENMPRLQRRIMRRLRNLRAIYSTGTIALVTHAELIRAAVLYCRHIPLESDASVEVEPTFVTAVHVSTAGARLLDVNRCLSVAAGELT